METDDMPESVYFPWYGVRTVYRWPVGADVSVPLYEERVVLIQAQSEDRAVEQAEREAQEYANDNEVEYLEVLQCYNICEPEVGSGVEVFSLLRESPLVTAHVVGE